MADKPHIVILARGDAGWLGGRQYSINLLRTLVLGRAGGDYFDVSVLVNGKDEIPHYSALRSELKICAAIQEVSAAATLPARARWKLMRTFGGWAAPWLEEPLLRIGATFVYPFSSLRVPSANWISDFQYHHYPDRMSAEEIAARKAEFSHIVAHARRIVLSSHCAERDCHTLYPSSIGRTHVLQFRAFADPAWVAADPRQTLAKYHLPERFVLISNWLLPTKNHALVLDALARLPAEERSQIHVVCTGDIYDYRNPGFYNRFLNRIHTLGLARHVSHLGVIPKHDQIQLLRAAVAYLQPSLFEGWNTGVEEARLFGKRILVSDIPIHREQAPARAIFFDPNDPSDLAAKLRALFDEPARAQDCREQEVAAFDAYAELQRDCARTFLAICNGARIASVRPAFGLGRVADDPAAIRNHA